MRTLLALAAPLLLSASPNEVQVARVDPLTVQDDDFARHRDAATWRGLTLERLTFAEERGRWRMWRIADPARPTGPLWFVPHDDENAGFEAALVAIRKHGGTIVAVDTGLAPSNDGKRTNAAVEFGRSIDPNRNFHDGLPRYAQAVLEPSKRGAWPIIALHTNGAGYDQTETTCGRSSDPPGRGVISIHVCNDIYQPSASKTRTYPFDDDDTVAIASWLLSKGPRSSFCGDALAAADFNVILEKVANTDGSLSNYAAFHGIDYLNFETSNRGLEPGPLGDARDRLVAMIDRAMAICPSRRP